LPAVDALLLLALAPADALGYTRRMYEITLGESEAYRLPTLDFRGTPTGIDVRPYSHDRARSVLVGDDLREGEPLSRTAAPSRLPIGRVHA
jgi:hypothetical protein